MPDLSPVPFAGRPSRALGAGRPSRRARPSRAATLVTLASLVLVASGLGAPASAAARVATVASPGHGGPGLAGPAPAAPPAGLGRASAHPIGRSIGLGSAVDPVRAARNAAASPRPPVSTPRLRVDLGARPASSPSSAAVRNPAGGATRSWIGTAPLVMTQPPPIITTKFAGIGEVEACTCEPPDPWIAVSPYHVVQTTNGLVRIYNRAGVTLLSMPTWALFAVPVDRLDSDPRILWDQVHGRWLGVLTTFRNDLSASGLRLAISETADPTAGWIVYPIEYGPGIPDYPGISSSATRIVLTSDDFIDETANGWLGPTWIQMDWSNIIGGMPLYIGGVSYRAAPGGFPPSFAHFRPAIMLSSATVTPVIYENAVDDDPSPIVDDIHVVPASFEIRGSAHDPVPDDDVIAVDGDLRHLGVDEFTLPPVPVQPGGLDILRAADERPTDAVYRSGRVWFTATADNFVDPDHWAKARWTQVTTSANGTPPTAAIDTFKADPGVHYVMPGVGINGRGSAIMAVTAMDPVSMNPTTLVGGIMADSGFSPFVPIETSPAAYIGTRWGDYLGIAADPAGAGSVWLAHELSDADGKWRTSVVRIVSDGTPPGAPGPFAQKPVIPSTLGATVPIQVSWGVVEADSGIASYLVERSDDGGGFFGVPIPGAAITQPLLIGHTVQYRVTATDGVGLVGPPGYSATFRPTLYQSTSSTTVTGTWRTGTSSGYSGGSTRYATAAGASATFTATAARSIAIVSTRANARGSFRVYVDGVYKATVSTYSTTWRFRQLVYQFNWSSAGTHKIKIVVSGTSGHPRVDLDAFVVLR
jgi:hypothetical protein